MQGFEVSESELLIGGQPLSALVTRVGQTPFYAYDRERIARTVADVRAALPAGIHLHYAVKANPFPELLAFMVPRVDGLDVASVGELQRALTAGMAPQAISFAGPGKRASELDAAVASGVLVNVESFREVPLLAEASARQGQPARVAVRVNPDFELRGAGMRMGGGAKPFGVDAEQVPALLRAIADAGLQFEGFHLYAGSQMLKADVLAQATRATGELLLRLSADAPAPVRHLNLGGGWGIPYFSHEQALDVAPVCAALQEIRERAAVAQPGVQLQIELGRYLVGEAGVYVAQVLDRKVSRGQVFLVTDGGMHHHLAASGNFGQVIRRNYPVAIGNRMDGIERELVSIVGPLCTPLDLLAEQVELPVARPGDWVVVFQSGAYGASASPQAFLGHPPCAEVLV